MKDSEILERIQKGDERALDYLYKQHFKMMSNLVIKGGGTMDEAKDVYQEALVAFWQKAVSGKLVLTSKISTFLYSICQNQWRKELDRKSRLSNEEVEKGDKPDWDEPERAKIIAECIEELGETCKKILTYYYFDGMNMTEIAEKMNFANTDTAKTKKYKCKMKLDALVKERYTENDFFD